MLMCDFVSAVSARRIKFARMLQASVSGGGGSSSSRANPKHSAPQRVLRASAKCASSKLALADPVAFALLEPLVQGAPAARVQRQAQAVIKECGVQNVSKSTALLAGLGASGCFVKCFLCKYVA